MSREMSNEEHMRLLQAEMETASAYAKARLLLQCVGKAGRSLAFLEAALPQCLRDEGLGFDWLSSVLGAYMADGRMYMCLDTDAKVRFHTYPCDDLP